MPSLRRTASQPAVKASRYPSFLSASSRSANNSPTTSRLHTGHSFRRSSDSEVSTRRVLADIEWWRVVDGQCDSNHNQQDQEQDQDSGLDESDDEPGHRLVMDALLNGAQVSNLSSSTLSNEGAVSAGSPSSGSAGGALADALFDWTVSFVEV